jgi:hypothetical protein
MNERIHELAEHCDFYIGNEHYDKSHEEQQRLFIEKFAELIVRECCSAIRLDDAFNGGKFQRTILTHFGVEE